MDTSASTIEPEVRPPSPRGRWPAALVALGGAGAAAAILLPWYDLAVDVTTTGGEVLGHRISGISSEVEAGVVEGSGLTIGWGVAALGATLFVVAVAAVFVGGLRRMTVALLLAVAGVALIGAGVVGILLRDEVSSGSVDSAANEVGGYASAEELSTALRDALGLDDLTTEISATLGAGPFAGAAGGLVAVVGATIMAARVRRRRETEQAP